jgi:cation/acetate symporter
VVAFAFGLAAASFFPIIVLGIFWKRANAPGAIAGMVTGLSFTALFIMLNRSVQLFGTEAPLVDSFFGITAQGIGTVGMLINFAVTIGVSLMTAPPPMEIRQLVDSIRHPHEDVGTAGRTIPAH